MFGIFRSLIAQFLMKQVTAGHENESETRHSMGSCLTDLGHGGSPDRKRGRNVGLRSRRQHRRAIEYFENAEATNKQNVNSIHSRVPNRISTSKSADTNRMLSFVKILSGG